MQSINTLSEKTCKLILQPALYSTPEIRNRRSSREKSLTLDRSCRRLRRREPKERHAPNVGGNVESKGFRDKKIIITINNLF